MLMLCLMVVSSLLAIRSEGVLQIYDDSINIALTMADRARVQDDLTNLIQGIQPRYVYNAGSSLGTRINMVSSQVSGHINLFFYAPRVCGPQFNSTVEYATGKDLQDRFSSLVDAVLELLGHGYVTGYVVSGQFQAGYSVEVPDIHSKIGCTTLNRNVTGAKSSEAHCDGVDHIMMNHSPFNPLFAGCQLKSINKKYGLNMTLDCKLLLVEAATNFEVWRADYNGAEQSGCYLIAEDVWNLVVYNGSRSPLWSSNTSSHDLGLTTSGVVWLEVSSNGRLVYYVTLGGGVEKIWGTTNNAADEGENVTESQGVTVFPLPRANVTTYTNVSGAETSKVLVIVLTTVVSLVALLLLCLLFIVIWQQRKLRRNKVQAKISKSMQFQLKNYSFKTLELATQGFDLRNKLGQGGYGVVYKGIIPTVGTAAIKRLQLPIDEGQVDFVNEVSTISSLQHKNLINLIGFCYEGHHRLLVYEYAEHNSLRHVLHGSKLHLPWDARFLIYVGIAKGIAYLHEESRLRIVHRDIKASNILLDKDLNPKIADFGLARFMRDSATHISTRIAGTFGYLAPEYALFGQVNEKVDVYSFGIVGLELMSGRENMDFDLPSEQSFILEWAWRLHEEGQWMHLVDKKLIVDNSEVEELHRVFVVSLLCTQADPAARPAMSRVVGMLTGDVELKLDASRPGFLSDLKEAARSSVKQQLSFTQLM